MKILFVARHFTYFRNFDSVVALLAGRGHAVHLAADRDEASGGRELVDRLAAQFPHVTVGYTPIHDFGRYTRVARALRLGLDYLRYSDPRYDTMPQLRQRAYERTPAFVLALARLPIRRLLPRVLERVEEAVPAHRGINDFIGEQRPDLLLVTPLIELGSPQLDYIRAARRLGVPSALCVWSWDHLSSKALIRVLPDHLIVWNETQREEAMRFHGVPPERVQVTGAQCFDRWFDRQPSRDRASFCRRAGLPDDRPFILYVCSALFRGSPSEADLVRGWVRAIRASSDPALRAMNILVRPHPQRLDEWQNGTIDGAALWGANPVDEESRADYFDSLYYSAAVVGLNTSALIEAAIVDRPVYTILLPEFHDNQEGTFHFHHLLTGGNGFLNAARTIDEHVRQLAAATSEPLGLIEYQSQQAFERELPAATTRGPHRALRGGVGAPGSPPRNARWGGAARPVLIQRGHTTRPPAASNRAFVEHFIRPRGLSVPATPVFVDTVEALVSRAAPAPRREPLRVFVLRPLVYALVLAGRLPLVRRIYWNPKKFRQLARA